ncbi:MAG: HAMP domain-containing protein [Candidimonas sp.]|nr:MAG: HAMP domain-containing protein [Candidimonas sp.]
MFGLKVGTRLGVGFGVILLLMVILAGMSTWRMMASTARVNSITDKEYSLGVMLTQWQDINTVNDVRAVAASTTTDPVMAANLARDMAKASARVTEIEKAVGDILVTPKGRAMFQAVHQLRMNYIQSRARALAAAKAGDAKTAEHYFKVVGPRDLAEYEQGVDKLIAVQRSVLAGDVRAVHSGNRLGIMLVIAVALLAIVVGVIFARLITRSVTEPLRSALALVRAVARRDLSMDVGVRGQDELAQLMAELEKMVKSLRDAIGEVQNGADTIASSSDTLSAGNEDLSSRTEQQASSLTETAATMEEITSAVRQNAESAHAANDLAQTAASTTRAGRQVVSELVTTMGDISEKSRQVSEIIKVIDGIAFQTNILALNAAVEAARAGDAGRGFAVVASEVRALAQRSATAAREIKVLIEASVQAATSGNEQATRAGAGMSDVVEHIEKATSAIGEINVAGREQTSGIEQVNIAVSQMDEATRQNTTLVENSARVVESLHDQAHSLAALVATFKLPATTIIEASAPAQLAAASAP